MKSTVLLATFALILLRKIINGQRNAVAYNENCETNNPKLQQQPILTYAIANGVHDVLNQNGNTAAIPNNINQQNIRVQTNTPTTSLSTHQIQLPPDLQQQPLQVHQYLQLQKPANPQQTEPLQQPLQLQPQMQLITQPQYPLEIQLDAQPLISLQSQDIPQMQQPILNQKQLQSDQSLQIFQPSSLQQHLQPLEALQGLQPVQLQPNFGFQEYYPQNQFTLPERRNFADTPFVQKINNNQPNSQIQIKWQSSNPLDEDNVENPYNTQNQNYNIEPVRTSINSPVEVKGNAQKFHNKPQDNPTLTYYVLSQPPASPSASGAVAPVTSNCHSTATKLNKISSPPNQSTQLHYYNKAKDLKQNTYVNQNSGIRYPEQSQLPVVLQNQPALLPSQSSILSPVPIPQVPTISSQYIVSSGYPVGTIVAPGYKHNKSTSSNLKSILPLIFQLLKEKITSCELNNNCPCECKNERSDNELEVASGYTSKKIYGNFDRDTLLDSVSVEEQDPDCIRETEDCDGLQNTEDSSELETSDEEEGSDEEQVDEEEDE